MRTSALDRPEAPLASAACSHRTTRPTPRAASAYAMLTPLTPPPTTMTSAVSVTAIPLSAGSPRPAGLQPATACGAHIRRDTLACAERRRPFHIPVCAVFSPMMGAQPFETIVGAHHAEIYRYLRRVTSRPAEAEDLSQETFLRAYRAHRTLGPDANVRAWLFA